MGRKEKQQHKHGNLTKRGRLSTVDLLVLNSLDQLLFILKILFTVIFNEEVNCPEPSLSVSIP
jgi:hypothetical protein